jgi:hypothetical protein
MLSIPRLVFNAMTDGQHTPALPVRTWRGEKMVLIDDRSVRQKPLWTMVTANRRLARYCPAGCIHSIRYDRFSLTGLNM